MRIYALHDYSGEAETMKYIAKIYNSWFIQYAVISRCRRECRFDPNLATWEIQGLLRMPPALSAISGLDSHDEDQPTTTHHNLPEVPAISEHNSVPDQYSSPTILATRNTASRFGKHRSLSTRRSTFPAHQGQNLAGSTKERFDVEKDILRKSNTAAKSGLKSKLS